MQLPWELACSPVGARRRPALINGLYRQIPRQLSAALTCSAWPFRILIVVGCSEADEAALGVAEEVALSDYLLKLGAYPWAYPPPAAEPPDRQRS
jgi:hypothetical protein